jgi:thiol-disulfide isomerase/thioredoxin
VQVNNEAALVNDIYKAFVYYYIVYETSRANGFNKFNDYSTAADRKVALARAKLTGEVLNTFLAQLLLDEKDHVAPFMLKQMLGTLKETDKTGKYYGFVSKACEPALQASKNQQPVAQVKATQQQAAPKKTVGDPSDEAGLMDLNGKPFSLGSLKGKVVYIDFWASWCGPCRVMMPYSKQLHDQLTAKQKKQIEFLYISIDADTNKWKQGIKAMGIEGLNLISPGNWSSPACRYFQINSIPRYMIMDKKGNIVDYNAKRPADPAILSDLLKLVDN